MKVENPFRSNRTVSWQLISGSGFQNQLVGPTRSERRRNLSSWSSTHKLTIFKRSSVYSVFFSSGSVGSGINYSGSGAGPGWLLIFLDFWHVAVERAAGAVETDGNTAVNQTWTLRPVFVSWSLVQVCLVLLRTEP